VVAHLRVAAPVKGIVRNVIISDVFVIGLGVFATQCRNLEARSADDFIADTVALDTGPAVAAARLMRQRFKQLGKTADNLLLDMEAEGLTAIVDVLRAHVASL